MWIYIYRYTPNKETIGAKACVNEGFVFSDVFNIPKHFMKRDNRWPTRSPEVTASVPKRHSTKPPAHRPSRSTFFLRNRSARMFPELSLDTVISQLGKKDLVMFELFFASTNYNRFKHQEQSSHDRPRRLDMRFHILHNTVNAGCLNCQSW